MRDGLYGVTFKTPRGAGAGVIHAVGGKIWGGDTSIFYVGTYSNQGEKLTAHVTTGRHAQGLAWVFGIDKVTIELQGTVNGGSVHCTGKAKEVPGVSFTADLRRIAD